MQAVPRSSRQSEMFRRMVQDQSLDEAFMQGIWIMEVAKGYIKSSFPQALRVWVAVGGTKPSKILKVPTDPPLES